jgi:ABC-2 type transport system ATP-binding protein
MPSLAIDIRDLVVERGDTTVLPGLTVGIDKGGITGLLGPSGCGKTTLMRSIVGVQKCKSGSVSVLGAAAGDRSLRKRVGYVTQAPSVYGDLDVMENLRYFSRILGVEASHIDHVITTVGLQGNANQRVDSLSGGQRARVSLATALLGEPEVLILDEPTVGLDPVLRNELWQTFHALADKGATLLVSSHVMDEADRCHNLLLMREGRLLAQGTPQQLRERTSADTIESAFLALIKEGKAA